MPGVCGGGGAFGPLVSIIRAGLIVEQGFLKWPREERFRGEEMRRVSSFFLFVLLLFFCFVPPGDLGTLCGGVWHSVSFIERLARKVWMLPLVRCSQAFGAGTLCSWCCAW